MVRAAAVHSLGQIRVEPNTTFPLLLSLINDPDPKLRENAILALGWMGDKAVDAIPALITLIADERLVMKQSFCINTAHPKHAATTALVGIGTAAIPSLIQSLDSPNAAVRLRSAEAISYFSRSAKSASKALLRRVRDTEECTEVRLQAFYALHLMDLDPKPFAAELVNLTRDDAPEIRCRAATYLGIAGLHNPISLDPLIQLLDDPDPQVRKSALLAVQLAAPKPVLESAIARLLQDPDESVRKEAQQRQDILTRWINSDETASHEVVAIHRSSDRACTTRPRRCCFRSFVPRRIRKVFCR